MADAGRVIAGSAKGIRLAAPGPGTRPLADRVKQTLFAVLEPDLEGAAVLDLFAGSGAGGIEALSRGASRAVFVERDGGAARVVAENLKRAGLASRAAVVRREAAGWLADPGGAAAAGPFDIVLMDRRTPTAMPSSTPWSWSARSSRPRASSSPSTSGATRRPPSPGC